MQKHEKHAGQFVEIAPDCGLEAAVVPQERGGKPTVATLEHEILRGKPYHYTLEELKFAVFVRRRQLSPAEVRARRKELWAECFAKPHACMRASPLAKQYGWGAHYDERGRIAIHAVESAEYRRLVRDRAVEKLPAMRSKRG